MGKSKVLETQRVFRCCHSARRKVILAIVHYKFRKKCPSKGLVDRDWQRRRVRNTAGCFAYTVLALYLRNLRCDFENMCVRMKKIPLHIDQTCDGNGQDRACLLLAPVFSFSRTGDAHFFTVLGYGSTRDIQPQSFQPFHKLVITERL